MTVKQYCIYLCRCTQEAAAGQQGMPEAPVADEVALRVCRQGRVLAVTVRLAHEDGMGTPRLVHWCGAQIQVRAPLVRRAALLHALTVLAVVWMCAISSLMRQGVPKCADDADPCHKHKAPVHSMHTTLCVSARCLKLHKPSCAYVSPWCAWVSWAFEHGGAQGMAPQALKRLENLAGFP